ncbi:DUF4236 domain-containing protein, partial [Pseudomonas aeruginosa]|nr:DUF4236 domain-containing protein [Pseudomonas aeruginosa]ELT7042771.1 DUF4236 domain-containing protein [Pseudomonas aeruginosa]
MGTALAAQEDRTIEGCPHCQGAVSKPGGNMGLSVRKSVRVGPFRFNLSKSGIGVS